MPLLHRLDLLPGRLYTQGPATVAFWAADHGTLDATDAALRAYTVSALGAASYGVTVATVAALPVGPDVVADALVVNVGDGLTGRVRALADRRGTAYWVEQTGTLLHVTPSTNHVTAYCLDTAARWWAPRLVRLQMTRQLRDRGGVHARAAACTIAGTGVLIMGPDPAAVAALLQRCVQDLAADVVADDRLVLVPNHRHGVLGYPWPILPGLAFGPQPVADPQSVGSIPPQDGAPESRPSPSAAAVSPTLMLWPRRDVTRTQPCPTRVAPAEVHDRMRLTQLCVVHDTREETRFPDWLTENAAVDVAHPSSNPLTRIAGFLADSVECWRITASSDLPALAAQVATLLQRTRHRVTLLEPRRSP